ncbi:MAG: response regulator [Nitrospirae bacterium]|nr:response regulator [Nitrospirota bacterium]
MNTLNAHKILVIDDSKSARQYAKDLLEENGYSVETASSGQEGIDQVVRYKPDVVLLDIEMPEFDGLEVLEFLCTTKHLYSIILFTTRSNIESRIDGLNRGADDYIVKPFIDEEFIARVSAACRTADLKKELTEAKAEAQNAYESLREAQNRMIEEQKVTALARLSGALAHELNNPLGFIKSNLSTLKKYSGFLADAADQLLASSSSAGIDSKKLVCIKQDISPLVSEVLDGFDRVSSIVQCLMKIDHASGLRGTGMHNISSLLSEHVRSFKVGLRAGIELTLDLPDRDAFAECNSEQLKYAIENVLQNSVDSIADDGKIKVCLSVEEGVVRIVVADTGCGISEKALDHIFEPFFTTEAHKKAGFGLTLAQYLIQAQAGKINVRSSQGSGTDVTIMLPAKSFTDELLR